MLKNKMVRLGVALTFGWVGLVAPQAAMAAAGNPGPEPAAGISVTDPGSARSATISAATLASSGCGSTCDGKNPNTFRIQYDPCYTCYYTCASDAKTVQSNFTGGVSLELRYSPRCRTAWTRVASDNGVPAIRSYYLDGRVRTSYSGFAGAYYTQMVNDANLLARAEFTNGPTTWVTAKY